MPNHDYRDGGLRRKYKIEKASGEPVDPEAVYFVLRVDEDPHARAALRAYADSVEQENATFAEELRYLAQSPSYGAFTQEWREARGFGAAG